MSRCSKSPRNWLLLASISGELLDEIRLLLVPVHEDACHMSTSDQKVRMAIVVITLWSLISSPPPLIQSLLFFSAVRLHVQENSPPHLLSGPAASPLRRTLLDTCGVTERCRMEGGGELRDPWVWTTLEGQWELGVPCPLLYHIHIFTHGTAKKEERGVVLYFRFTKPQVPVQEEFEIV